MCAIYPLTVPETPGKFVLRLLYLVSHPIQYQAPLLRLIARDDDIQLTVLFEHMGSTRAYYDQGFETEIAWDKNLTDGYTHNVVTSSTEVEDKLRETDVFWVHGWDTWIKRRALNAAWQLRVPVLMRAENTLSAMPDGPHLRGVLKRAYLKSIFRHCRGFLCIGSDNRAYYASHGVEPTRLFEMPYAVDNVAFQMASQGSGIRARELYSLEAGRPIILFAGKFLKRKNPMLLLEACRKLDREKTRDPYLVFVGEGEEGARLRDLSKDLDWVRFLGFRNQSELPSIYAMSDVFALPSRGEPWGLAVNEAMACGTAVISTDQCGCSTDLVDNVVGRSVPANDCDALVAALIDVLADAGASEAMGHAAQDRIATWSYAEDIAGLKAALTAIGAMPSPA